MGYSNRFNGLGVIINTLLRKEEDGEYSNYIQGFVGDGVSPANFIKIAETNNCLAKVRNLPEALNLRIKYEHPNLGVFI